MRVTNNIGSVVTHSRQITNYYYLYSPIVANFYFFGLFVTRPLTSIRPMIIR